jgi:glutamine amidotransferase
MCRVAAVVGAPAPLSLLLYDAPHSLERQAYAPREMLAGTVNVDGTGVAWWPEGDVSDEPVRYVTERPPWSDPNLPLLAHRFRARAALAAVRSATPGMPFGPGAVAPFVHGPLAGAHNGWLGRFREGTGRALGERLPPDLYAALDAVNDSLFVFLTVVKHHRARPEAGLAAAVAATVREVVDVCAAHEAEAALNVVVTDGARVVATRASHRVEGTNPLSVCQGGARWPGATVVASEPLDDDPAWEAVPPDHLVDAGADGLTVRAL